MVKKMAHQNKYNEKQVLITHRRLHILFPTIQPSIITIRNIETLIKTYKTFIRALFDYRCIVTDRLIQTISPTKRRIIRKFRHLPWDHPPSDVYSDTNMTPINERLTILQRRFIARNPESTTPLESPWNINRPLPHKPAFKYPWPPEVLL